LENKLFQ